MREVCPGKRGKLDWGEIRRRLEQTKGPEYWRSLEELAASHEFRDLMGREFPRGASEWLDGLSRRGFLKLMGASLALAGLGACTKQPLEPIVPYVKQPEEFVPGRPLFYASAFTMRGYATPILVESHLGRPTKIEGNREHPATGGGTDAFAQASLLDLYDPDRSQTITYLGDPYSWSSFLAAFRGPLAAQKAVQGSGIRILTQTVSSPTLADQLRAFLKLYPAARWHIYEPVNRDHAYGGAQMVCGQPLETQYRLEKADVILSLDADFLYGGYPGFTRLAADYASRRHPEQAMNRLYVVESTATSTGAKADHRLPLPAGRIEQFARTLHRVLESNREEGLGAAEQQPLLSAVARDLRAHRGRSAVIVGDNQPPVVHALGHLINETLGNVGQTLVYTDPVSASPENSMDSVRELVSDLRGGKVDMLIILGGNPVYDAPRDLDFADALKNSRVPLRIHLGLYQNETAELCHWHLNEAHYLEAWGDTRSYDGTVSIIQPLIAPLYDGKSMYEFMALLSGQSEAAGYQLVQGYWQKQHGVADFDSFWRRALHDGWIAGTAFAPRTAVAKAANLPAAASPQAEAIEINFRPDPTIWDGRFSNNAWLQELPKPMSKMTWDNPVYIAPAMAARLKVEKKDLVELELGGRRIQVPVWVQAGQPDNTVTVFLGYGRRRAGRTGTGFGFDFYELRAGALPWFTTGVGIRKISGSYDLASTQGMQSMDAEIGERPLVRETDLDEYRRNPNFAQEQEPAKDETLYPVLPGFDYAKEPYAWGMAIDLNACVGCNNCIVACQAENNIPVVGKEQVIRGRHMHWLRVDTYYQGDRDEPRAFFQPVPCMQCEHAPCEVVCPVGATVHSTEGLNDMVYNRCVGTRYCSNNCPYKVRRFNFLRFQDWDTPQFKMMRNPNVTVRSRGVMEKCTYCIQRITQHRVDAERADTLIKDGELETACQQSCPTRAIIFGNINDPHSKVAQLKRSPRNYSLLGELNTRPRTTYLAEIRNPSAQPRSAGQAVPAGQSEHS
ncbi:MAG: TAT-variant-translocated molybdopterin oxidoreductase [Acidobacteria bacterium]|nr:TAT-variant-translocated molybdopterin oxidoreductase [Acidobacteriota bacterium]